MKNRIIIKNGKLMTMDDKYKGSWILIEDEEIKAVGAGEQYRTYISEDTNVIDAKGATVLPGFIDSHFHMMKTAISENSIDLSDVTNFHSLGKKLKAAAKKQHGKFIIANGLNCAKLDERRYPDRTVLDRYCNNMPVVIYSTDYHLLILNTYGILYFKVPFTLNGVELDRNSLPTGIFRHQAGTKLDINIITSFSDEDVNEAIDNVIPKLFRCGVTTIAAIEGSNVKAVFDEDYESEFIYKYRDRYPLDMELFYQTTKIERVLQMGLPRIGGNLYLDGTLSQRTAALTFEYADAPGKQGYLCFTQDYLDHLVEQCCQNNLQISLDAIGDAAIESALIAFQKASEKYDVKAMRHRIEHCELITSEQMKKAAEYGIILSMQPNYEWYWGYPGGMYQQRLGGNYGKSNQFREIINEGITICGGSDSSVTPPDPLQGIHCAVNHPVASHRITLDEAVRMYTLNGAYGLFRDNEIGSLTPGKIADVVILDQDLTALPSTQINKAKVVITIKRGKILFDRSKYADNKIFRRSQNRI